MEKSEIDNYGIEFDEKEYLRNNNQIIEGFNRQLAELNDILSSHKEEIKCTYNQEIECSGILCVQCPHYPFKII